MGKSLGYLAAFAVPALLPLGAWLGATSGRTDLFAWTPLFGLFVALPVLDVLLGRDRRNPTPDEERALERNAWFRALTLLALPVQCVLLAWSTWYVLHAGLGPAGIVGWVLSQGVVSGVLAINVAHELVHKDGWLERVAGGALLCTVGYHGFKVEHVRGHHVHVATPRDSSSARLGQSLWHFLPRALWRNTANAWRLEAARLHRLGRRAWSPRNEMLRWTLLHLAMVAAVATAFGAAGAAFFLVQGLFAAVSLEIINYVEHYGLERRRGADGRYERTTHLHSWNADFRLTNLLLFQLQRHSDHHETPRRRYQVLRHHDDSPQLPAGYATMFLLALVPPLWRRVMDPRARVALARV